MRVAEPRVRIGAKQQLHQANAAVQDGDPERQELLRPHLALGGAHIDNVTTFLRLEQRFDHAKLAVPHSVHQKARVVGHEGATSVWCECHELLKENGCRCVFVRLLLVVFHLIIVVAMEEVQVVCVVGVWRPRTSHRKPLLSR